MKALIAIAISAQTIAYNANAECKVFNSQNQIVEAQGDVLYSVLTNTNLPCPANVLELKEQIKNLGGEIAATMVANRGFHNPNFGSFSFFENVTGQIEGFPMNVEKGDFTFGHFTGKTRSGQLVLDQNPRRGALMIELIVWDAKKNSYNFYELIGQGGSSQWFYRGDTQDIFEDNKNLYLSQQPGQFGQKLRCSGCHVNGGPIIKEFQAPHNAWWEDARGIPLGGAVLSTEVAEIMKDLEEASTLANNTEQGMQKWADNLKVSDFSLQEWLRPLFCPMEVQFASSPKPLQSSAGTVTIPSEFFVDAFWGKQDIKISQSGYIKALEKFGFQFPETSNIDADHAWLTPVKAWSDSLIVKTAIKLGIYNEEFVADVLAVNAFQPVFSQTRCELLKLTPKQMENWESKLASTLEGSSQAGAQELFKHMTDGKFTQDFHQTQISASLKSCGQNAEQNLDALLGSLQWKRQQAGTWELAQNPRGQILEPGFRVIFPTNSVKMDLEPVKLETHCVK